MADRSKATYKITNTAQGLRYVTTTTGKQVGIGPGQTAEGLEMFKEDFDLAQSRGDLQISKMSTADAKEAEATATTELEGGLGGDGQESHAQPAYEVQPPGTPVRLVLLGFGKYQAYDAADAAVGDVIVGKEAATKFAAENLVGGEPMPIVGKEA